MDQVETLRNIMETKDKKSGSNNRGSNQKMCERGKDSPVQVIAVTSGKGGVGKTNVVANLGYALSKSNKRVMILDADVGLANIDVLLGLTPKYTLQHVLTGEKSVSEIMLPGPGGVKILPASSGIQELSDLSSAQKLCLLSELNSLYDQIDVLLIDTSAGISSNVIYFNLAAQEILVVVSPEPTSITDAYAMMKVLCLKYSENHFRLLVNSARSATEAEEVFNNLSLVGQKFLNLSIDYWGYIEQDEYVAKAVRQQKALVELYPLSPASQCFSALARKVCENRPNNRSRGNIRFFWNHFLEPSESFPLSLSRM